MAFGLKTAPAFQKMMSHTLKSLEKFSTVYLDDVIIFSRDFRTHLHHLRKVLERLKDAGLVYAPEKCKFAQTEITYLSTRISSTGNKPEPKNLEAINELKVPKNRKDLRKFVGLANWVRSYIPKFSTLAAPLNALLSTKKAPFKAALQKLTLHRPDHSKHFILQMDASGEGMATVLYQEEVVERRIVTLDSSVK